MSWRPARTEMAQPCWWSKCSILTISLVQWTPSSLLMSFLHWSTQNSMHRPKHFPDACISYKRWMLHFFPSLSGCCEASSSMGSPWGWAGQSHQPKPVPPSLASRISVGWGQTRPGQDQTSDISVGWGQTRPGQDGCGSELGPVSAAPMAWHMNGCNPAKL